MFERLVCDGNWIGDGNFFRHVDRLEQKKFVQRFMDRMPETVVLRIASNQFIYGGKYKCALFSDGNKLWPVQITLLEIVGVDVNDLYTYEFRIDLETKMIFISDPDFLGGVMPMGEI